MEVENCLDDISGLPNDSKSNPETSHQGHKWNAMVRQQVLELEGPGYQYKPMFGSDTMSEVFMIVSSVSSMINSDTIYIYIYRIYSRIFCTFLDKNIIFK